MPSLEVVAPHQLVKMLYMGESGSGKTGSTAALAKAGYKLRFVDYDAGIQILLDDKILPPEFRKNVIVETLQDNLEVPIGMMKNVQGPSGKYQQVQVVNPAVIGTPQAFGRGMLLMDRWKTETEDLGPVKTWGSDSILIIDSLTMLALSALRYQCFVAGRKEDNPWPADWGEAQRMLESFLGMVTNQKAVPCHLIVICHVSYQSAEDLGMPQGTPARGLPITVGRQLSPKVARYFNTFIQAKTQGSSKIIETVSNPNTELKVPVPSKIPNQLPLDTGLATIFEAITGKATP